MTPPAADGRRPAPAARRSVRALGHGLGSLRRWFRAFRRTRPFWGGLWCILAGAEIIKAMSFSLVLALTGGFNFSAGYILGGALVLFGLVAWFAPLYRGLVGIVAFLVALAAFAAANLGGYLLGTLLGIIGGSMIWAWGEKKPRRHLLRRRGAKGGPSTPAGDAAASEA